MNRFVFRTLCVAALAASSACGEAPPGDFPKPLDAPAAGNLQQVTFTGVAEPATGRLQIFMGPQAAFARIPESADGNALTVAANTVQVYAPTVSFVTNNALYPAGCSRGAPWLMQASVEVFSGYTEQLRNVYANLAAKSASPTACATNSLGSFAGAVGTSFGAYLYQPLNLGTGSNATKRTVQWNLTLGDNTPFWFSGDIWAEIIPAPPTIVSPPDTGLLHTDGAATGSFTINWTNDPRADGLQDDGFVVARPTSRGARLTFTQCGTGATFVPGSCTLNLYRSRTTALTYTRTGLTVGRWYQYSLESAFRLPNSTTTRYGVITTRYFQVVNP